MSSPLLPVYNRAPLSFERGMGSWLYTEDGTAYLDCVAGIATASLGHAHPPLVRALLAQSERLWHVSNMFQIPGQELLAQRLTDACFADYAFFCNSGSEAVECALKIARRYHHARGDAERITIIGFEGSFHGRTYASLNAAGNPTYLEGFGPPLLGYRQLPFGDLDALEIALASQDVAAVILEPVQGEGGARALTDEDLQAIRRLCSAQGVLLIYDEIQCGMGRTGKLFAHQRASRAEPDVMTVAKALGGGFPVGACLATAQAASGMAGGTHGSTFGGNPLAMAVALAAFAEIATPELLAHVCQVSDRMRDGLAGLQARYPAVVTEIRGRGLLIGVQLAVNNRECMARARDQHLLIAAGGENCIRLLPPLNLAMSEADEAIARLDRTFATFD